VGDGGVQRAFHVTHPPGSRRQRARRDAQQDFPAIAPIRGPPQAQQQIALFEPFLQACSPGQRRSQALHDRRGLAGRADEERLEGPRRMGGANQGDVLQQQPERLIPQQGARAGNVVEANQVDGLHGLHSQQGAQAAGVVKAEDAGSRAGPGQAVEGDAPVEMKAHLAPGDGLQTLDYTGLEAPRLRRRRPTLLTRDGLTLPGHIRYSIPVFC